MFEELTRLKRKMNPFVLNVQNLTAIIISKIHGKY
jgi:hypothetical protein